jgi:hypothetical protein
MKQKIGLGQVFGSEINPQVIIKYHKCSECGFITKVLFDSKCFNCSLKPYLKVEHKGVQQDV